MAITEELAKRLGITAEQAKKSVIYQGKGCSACGDTGYLGRLPIFEFLVIDNDISEKIISGANESEIRTMSRQKGYGGLFESGVHKILEGLTTPEEVIGVAFTGR
jgi:type II secretory ATPase GspE/PulE/Tfp pilus assembly ATPase PilB-like protein